MASIVPFRKVDPETEYLRCSRHPLCEGPTLRADHDEVCDRGPECDDECCWRGCRFCIADGDVQ